MNLDSNQFKELSEDEQSTLNKLAKLKPRVSADPKFASLLRTELDEVAQAKMGQQQVSKKDTTHTINTSLTFISFMNKLIIPLIAVAIVASGAGYWYASNNGPALLGVGDNQILSGKYAVTEVDQNSFGDLNKINIINEGRGGGGGATPQADSSVPATGMGGGGKMIAPGEPYPCEGDCGGAIYYKFKYVGDKLTNLPDSEGVLKRSKPAQPQSLISKLLGMFSFGLIDLTKFQNTRMQSVSFMEDRDFGLSANIDLNIGSISMYQNWEKWPQYNYGCYGYSCGNMPRLEPKDIPSDDDLIKIADQFMADYKISSEGYGKPFVYDYSNWRIMYENAKDKTSVYLPEQINVIYPLVLEGQTVYDESGSQTGLSVMVDVRTKRVASVYGLDTKQFQKSEYKGETDANRILDIAERGGYRNYSYEYPGKVVTLELGTPSIQMIRMWYTENPNQQGEDLYMPAYIFPINNADQTNYWRKNVIVPLVRDILDNENPQQPMPMGAADSGAAGTVSAVMPKQ